MAGLVGAPGEENVDCTGCREYPDGRAWHYHDDDDDDDNNDDDDDDDGMMMVMIPWESCQLFCLCKLGGRCQRHQA